MQFLFSIWKILHLTEYFYTGTAHGARNNYQVWLQDPIKQSCAAFHCCRPDWNTETWHILESAWLGNNNLNERDRAQNQKVGRKSEPCFCFEQRMCVHLRQRMWAHLRQSSRANWQEIKNCRQNLTLGSPKSQVKKRTIGGLLTWCPWFGN